MKSVVFDQFIFIRNACGSTLRKDVSVFWAVYNKKNDKITTDLLFNSIFIDRF